MRQEGCMKVKNEPERKRKSERFESLSVSNVSMG